MAGHLRLSISCLAIGEMPVKIDAKRKPIVEQHVSNACNSMCLLALIAVAIEDYAAFRRPHHGTDLANSSVTSQSTVCDNPVADAYHGNSAYLMRKRIVGDIERHSAEAQPVSTKR